MISKIKSFITKTSPISSRLPHPSAPPEMEFIAKQPFKGRISGYVKICGPIKKDWIKDILKKISILISCELLHNSPQWKPLTVQIAYLLKDILYKNILFSSHPNTQKIQQIFSTFDKFFCSQLSYIPITEPFLMKTIDRIWDFLLPTNYAITISYEIKIVLERYQYKNRDSLLLDGYYLLDLPTPEWEDLINMIYIEVSDPFDIDKVFALLKGDSRRLKKSLIYSSSIS